MSVDLTIADVPDTTCRVCAERTPGALPRWFKGSHCRWCCSSWSGRTAAHWTICYRTFSSNAAADLHTRRSGTPQASPQPRVGDNHCEITAKVAEFIVRTGVGRAPNDAVLRSFAALALEWRWVCREAWSASLSSTPRSPAYAVPSVS
jgi:hypothetical protein